MGKTKDDLDQELLVMNDLTFHKCWSSAGGAHSAWLHAVNLLKSRAGQLYVGGKDEQAKLVRDIALEFEVERLKASAELQRYINANSERP